MQCVVLDKSCFCMCIVDLNVPLVQVALFYLRFTSAVIYLFQNYSLLYSFPSSMLKVFLQYTSVK